MKELIIICLFFNITGAICQTSNALKNANVENGIALGGYDPVSYFELQEPVKGKPTHSFILNGIKYFFGSSVSLNKFKSNPSLYLPEYGGWCAYAMGATGEKVEVDPLTYKIKEGKLYLFYNFYFNNTLNKWNKDEQKLQSKADKNWKILIVN